VPTAADAPFVAYAAGAGERLRSGATIVGRAEWTDGAFISIAADVAPGFFSPVHKHLNQSQTSVVLAGELGFWVEGEEDVILGPGGYVSRPKGRHHAFWNPTDQPARVLEITSPATEFQEWMLDVSEMMSGDGASKDEVAERAGRAGIVFAAELTQQLAERLGLSGSPVFGR
jgi:quercetin dioxygenase-like cupin family protein